MVQKRLKEILIENIESGYRFFGSGGARGFDTVAAMAVLEFKKVHPDIKLILVLPCREQTRGWSETDVQKHKCTTTPPYSLKKSCQTACGVKYKKVIHISTDRKAVGLVFMH